MSTIHLTQYLCWAGALFFIAYDIWVILDRRERADAISEQIKAAALHHLWIPMSVGVLLGHWFAPHVPGVPAWTPLVLLALGVALIVIGAVRSRHGAKGFRPRTIFAAALLGIPLGALLWTQPDAKDLHDLTQQELERTP